MSKVRENIINLIKKPKTPVVKPPMHVSTFTKAIKKEIASQKKCHQTMGCPEVKRNDPSQFLKKQTRKIIRPFVGKIKILNNSTCKTIRVLTPSIWALVALIAQILGVLKLCRAHRPMLKYYIVKNLE